MVKGGNITFLLLKKKTSAIKVAGIHILLNSSTKKIESFPYKKPQQLYHELLRFLLIQFLTIRGNNIPIPIKRFFLITIQGAISLVVFIDVNKTVTLTHLTSGGTD